jgi:hypothetical protein
MSNNYYFKRLMANLPANRCQFETEKNGSSAGTSGSIRRSGTTGSCRWTLAGERRKATLTISGLGAMGDYSEHRTAPWYRYAGDIGRLVVEEGVTAIGRRAFADCYNLTAISIAPSVTTVGAGAFYSCLDLKTAALPDSVSVVSQELFCGCSNLCHVRIGRAVERVDNYAFWGCGSLMDIPFPDTLISIGDQAFWGCSELRRVLLPDSVKEIGFAAFLYCAHLHTVTIGRSVVVISDLAFTGIEESTLHVTNFCPSPQAIRPIVFERVDLEGSTLRVPSESVDAYRQAAVWGEFGEIRGV